MPQMKKYPKKTYRRRRPYNMVKRRRIGYRKKYQGVKYFTERIQLANLEIPALANTQGGVTVFNMPVLSNYQPLAQLFDLFSVVSLKYEIRPINSYTFGTSPVPAPNITYAIEENPDSWTAPTAKIQLLEKSNSKTRTLDTQKTSVINVYQKLPQIDASQMENFDGQQVNTLDVNRRKFKWYSIADLNPEGGRKPNFGALRWWMELPSGSVGSAAPLEVAEHYITVRYACKEQM